MMMYDAISIIFAGTKGADISIIVGYDDSMAAPVILRFGDRTVQGPWFHLTTVDSRQNRLVGLHGHDYDEIFWLDAGRCRHRCNGQDEILSAGDLVLMRASDVHVMSEVDRAFRFTNLALAPRLSRALRQAHPESWDALYAGDQPFTRRLERGELAEHGTEAARLAGRPHTRLAVEYLVLGTWLRCLARRGTARSDGLPDWLQEALLRIEEPEIAARGVPGLVAVAGRSAAHVSRECRRWLGRTSSQVVNAARMRYAAAQLRLTTRPVAAIAADCGFEDPGRFYALFKRYHDTTPAAYRRQ